MLQTLSRAAVKFFLWVILSPYICFMFTLLYFLLSSVHLFTSPVQVRNAFYCKTLCRNLPRVFLDVLCSSRGSSACCSDSSPLCFVSEAAAFSVLLRNPQPWRWQWDGGAGQAITRELMLCGDGGDPGGLSCLRMDVSDGAAVAMGPPHLQLAGFGGLWLPCLKLGKLQRALGAAGEMRHSV